MVDKKVTDMAPLADPSGAVVYGVKNATDHQIMVGSMVNKNDAPSDGKNYVRKNGSWVEGGVLSVNGESGTVELTSADIPHIESDLVTITTVQDSLRSLEQFYGRVVNVTDNSARLNLIPHPDITIAIQTDNGTVWVLPATLDPNIPGNWSNISNLNDVSIHVGHLDPHLQYLNTERGDGRYIIKTESGMPLGVAPLNAQGKVDMSYLPPLAVGRREIVADQTARLSLSIWPDLTIAIQTDDGSSWLLDANADPAVPSNWTLNGNTTNSVSSFNSRTGNVLPISGDYTADQITPTLTREFVTPLQKTLWNNKLSDAPVDGVSYLRRNGDWAPSPAAVASVNEKTPNINGNVQLTKDDLGLDNVDNTDDMSKPVSIPTQEAILVATSTKQDTLISGSNIKTVNGNSLLGSGDIEITSGVTAINALTGNVSILAGENIAISTSESDILISAAITEIRTPTTISPATGDVDVSVTPTLVANIYGSVYGFARQYREFQIDVVGGDWTTPVLSEQALEDHLTVSSPIADNQTFNWRCRDVDVYGTMSNWSVPATFTTFDIYVATPSILYPLPGGVVQPDSDPFQSSEYEAFNTTETHAASYWEILGSEGQLLFSSGRNIVDLLSYQVPNGVILPAGRYAVRVRYEGSAGTTSEWSAPVSFIGAGSASGKFMAIASSQTPYATVYAIDVDNFVALPPLTAPPTGVANVAAFSPDGDLLAFGHQTAPRITIYSRSDSDFITVPEPDVLPSGTSVTGAAFSPDSNTLIVCSAVTPFMTIYNRTGTNFTKMPNPASLPPSTARSVAYSRNGEYVAITLSLSPFLNIYKVSGNSFTKLPNPVGGLPAGNAQQCVFSPDSNYLVVTHFTSPAVTIYRRDGDVFTKLSGPDIPPNGNGFGVGFSPDGNILVIGSNNTPVSFYRQSGDSFTRIPSPAVVPTATVLSVAFSQDGNHLALGNSSGLFLYSVAGEEFTRITNPAYVPTGSLLSITFWP